MTIDTTLREGVIALARGAAADILKVYAQDFDVQHKGDDSPLTQADLASHRRIVAGLQALAPDIPIVSEESAHATPAAQRLAWNQLWLVDPLDGTREFVKRNGEFTVNIALIEDGVPVFGVIQQPVGGGLWWADAGLGAFAHDADGNDRPLRSRSPAEAPVRVAASRSHRDERTSAAMARMGECDAVACGSSLKFCRIAEGAIDVYPRFGPTSEWDTAAGQAIVEAAGGVVLGLDGAPLRYNRRDTLLNGEFIALGDPALPWRDWLDG